MRLRGHNDDELHVSLSIDELVLMKNVLHEVCNGMDFTEADFHAIFGASRRELESLLMRATGVLDHLHLVPE
jgi:hypothetical protein